MDRAKARSRNVAWAVLFHLNRHNHFEDRIPVFIENGAEPLAQTARTGEQVDDRYRLPLGIHSALLLSHRRRTHFFTVQYSLP